MPRLRTFLLRQARHLHPLLPLLLRPCRDLPSARNELRWLREHVLRSLGPDTSRRSLQQRLYKLCRERSAGKPLQYILGNQPFGDLDILCKSGVLIPRPETENITTHLATLLLSHIPKNHQPPHAYRILDLCSGTGCISLLLHFVLLPRISSLQILGLDISPEAIALANANLSHNIPHGFLSPTAMHQTSFRQADVFTDHDPAWKSEWDIIVANPPYISPKAFNITTSRSVRNYEPKIALVPPPPSNASLPDIENGDIFYPRLLKLAHQVRGKVLLMEVADMAQAVRVMQLVIESKMWNGFEIWRDWPAVGGGFRGWWEGNNGRGTWEAGNNAERKDMVAKICGQDVKIVGEGHGRAVLAWREEGWRILGRREVESTRV